MIDWLETIPNEKLRSDVKKKISYQGGCHHHFFFLILVNDDDDIHITSGSIQVNRNNYTG
jgi:hypothetical protein